MRSVCVTGNERRTGAAEGVEHHGVCHRAVLNGIASSGIGFMVGWSPFSWACRTPRWWTLFARCTTGACLSSSSRKGTARAATGTGSVPAPGTASSRYSSRRGRTLRHQTPFGVQPFGVGMEHINGRIVRHDLLHIGKGIEEKVEKTSPMPCCRS